MRELDTSEQRPRSNDARTRYTPGPGSFISWSAFGRGHAHRAGHAVRPDGNSMCPFRSDRSRSWEGLVLMWCGRAEIRGDHGETRGVGDEVTKLREPGRLL